MNSDQLKKRTHEFAHRCIALAHSLPRTTLGYHIEKQLIRSSTSVAANYRAALHAISKAAFISKISIVIEEADETEYWMELINEEGLIPDKQMQLIQKEAQELTSIFVSTRRSAQGRNPANNKDDENFLYMLFCNLLDVLDVSNDLFDFKSLIAY
jgi:four helix bundle protein